MNRIKQILPYFLMALPFLTYFYILGYYTVDIPVWDDYVNPLDMTNQAIDAKSITEKLKLLATPMNGHIPFLPRVLLYLQYLCGASSSIKTALLVSGLGWGLATLLLITYCHRRYALSLPVLVPIPYLLLSITHWEAMDFYSSAFQMYWGSGLLAITGIIALAEKKPLVASLCLLGGIFSSGGTLAAYPVCLLMILASKQWKSGFLFLLFSVPALLLYSYTSPPGQNLHHMPDIIALSRYVLEFGGNLSSNGQWDVSPLAQRHTVLGSLLIMFFIYYSWRIKSHIAIKAIFAYVLLMGAMAGYARLDNYAHAVSRYAMYALLAACCLYILIAIHHKTVQTRTSGIAMGVMFTLGFLVWSHALLVCRTPLQTNHDQRISSMKSYIKDQNPAGLLSWNADHAKKVLEDSIRTGLYDYRKSTH